MTFEVDLQFSPEEEKTLTNQQKDFIIRRTSEKILQIIREAEVTIDCLRLLGGASVDEIKESCKHGSKIKTKDYS